MIVFMVEELSMHVTLQELLPKVFPAWQEKVDWLCLTHEGKNDLKQSIRRKLLGWRLDDDKFVILHDRDSADCIELKQNLKTICALANKPNTLIRIPCPELEAWFLGDLDAVAKAFQNQGILKHRKKRRYRNPDSIINSSETLSKLTNMTGKVRRARMIAAEMDIDKNCSHSFNVFIDGLRSFT